MSENEDTRLQHLKAAVHYTVGKIAEEVGEEHSITISRQVIAVISELTLRQISLYAVDLECFAKHAKRSVIGIDDVKLLVRKSPEMAQYLDSKIAELSKPSTSDKKRGRKRNVQTVQEEKTSEVVIE